MDSPAPINRLKNALKTKKKAAFAVLAVFAVGGLVAASVLTAPRWIHKSGEMPRFGSTSRVLHLFDAFTESFQSAQDKVAMLRRAVEENERLRLETANLRLRAESLQFDCTNREAAKRTQEFEMKFSKETGARVGRSLASIYYRPPTHLLPPELYTLGVSYFKAREDEKAAYILTVLTSLEENDTFKTPKNHLMTGIVWYRLDNYQVADQYFEKVLQSPETQENLAFHAQARLWRGMASERMGKHQKAQYWLRDLIDHHPHSTEAAWVNSREAGRVPSSED